MKYYVYELVIEPDDRVCYVGKGSGKRMYKHRRRALQSPSKGQLFIYQELRSLLASGKDFKPRKVFATDNEREALAEERRRIRLYGVETLFNWGECHTGPLACQMKEARREAMRGARLAYVAKLQSETGRKMLPEIAAKISAANTGHKVAPETVAKIQAGRAANPSLQKFLVEHCRELASAQRGVKHSPEHVEKAHAPLRGRKLSEAVRARMSAGMIGKGPRTGAKSQYRGVSWFEPKKAWQCRIQLECKTKLLGQFKLELDAAFTYDNAFEKAHGSRPNATLRDRVVTRFRPGMHGKLIPV